MSQAPWLSTEDFDSRVHLVGLGGIGSWAMLALSKMGIKVHGYDMDRVEAHNIGGQLYGPGHDGMFKSSAMMNICSMLSDDYHTSSTNTRVTSVSFAQNTPIVALAVDSMSVRKELYESWKRTNIPHFIDIRMSSEVIHGYVVDRTQEAMERYERSLFNDEDVPDEDCTFKATTYCGMMAGAVLASAVANIFFGRPTPEPIALHLPSWFEIPIEAV